MFKFWNEAGDEKEKEEMSLKKAVRRFKVISKINLLVLNISVKKVNRLLNL